MAAARRTAAAAVTRCDQRSTESRVQPPLESGPRPDAHVAAHLVHLQHRRTLDRDERGHHDLHARVRSHAGGNELVSIAEHHPSRQRHRADSDDPQRTRRHEVRRELSGDVSGELRRAWCQCAGNAARGRRLRLVRYPDLDRRARPQHAPHGGVGRVGARARWRRHLVCDLLARAGAHHCRRHRAHQAPWQRRRTGAAHRWYRAALLGDTPRRRARQHPRPIATTPGRRGRELLGPFPAGAYGKRGILGHPEPQHP